MLTVFSGPSEDPVPPEAAPTASWCSGPCYLARISSVGRVSGKKRINTYSSVKTVRGRNTPTSTAAKEMSCRLLRCSHAPHRITSSYIYVYNVNKGQTRAHAQFSQGRQRIQCPGRQRRQRVVVQDPADTETRMVSTDRWQRMNKSPTYSFLKAVRA